jgi:hypothetical protein
MVIIHINLGTLNYQLKQKDHILLGVVHIWNNQYQV